VLRIEGEDALPYDAEIRHGEKVVGRVTSAARDGDHVLALGYVRVDVPDDAGLVADGRPATLDRP
jgi:hypothetical protein